MTATPTSHRLADDPQMPTVGSMVGQRYEVQGVLGEGGFAVVYRAFDTRTKASVAVKVLDPLMSRRNEFAARFMREVETVSRLRHHNTISIFDAGETDGGCLYLVMELLEGRPLDTVLEQGGALSADRVRSIAAQILKSLQEAHGKGIIHRDLKPANVFLADLAGEQDYVKVLDFGIAKSVDESANANLTATGQVMCSPHYVAPERVKDHLTVPASDLYSLGVMMIELLEGRPPYEADSPMMLAVKHLSAEPVPMGEAARSAPFAAVIAKACSKSLDQRYASAQEMLTDLVATSATGALSSTSMPIPAAGWTQAMEPSTDTDPIGEFAGPGARRGPLLVAAAAALLLIGGGVAWALRPDPAPPAPVETTAPAPAPPVAVAPPPADEPPDPTVAFELAAATVHRAVDRGAAEAALEVARQSRAAAEAEATALQEATAGAASRPRSGTRSEPAARDRRDPVASGEAAAAAPIPAAPIPAPAAAPEAAPVVAAPAPSAPATTGESSSPRPIRTNVAPRL
ncbi:MAG: serine/threonine protein kinase [Myxococcales bacterium]|nr:serine/threonine protein kinase [Myxococcales bacterium]MCB9530821.1 serine/threonine protein kinase [Myxococcales bacterium]